MRFGDTSQGSKFSNPGVSENDIDSPLRLDGLIESVKVGQFGNVALNAGNVAADCLDGLIKFLLATARDEDVGPLSDEEFCRSKPYARRTAGDDCRFSFQLAHWSLLPLRPQGKLAEVVFSER